MVAKDIIREVIMTVQKGSGTPNNSDHGGVPPSVLSMAADVYRFLAVVNGGAILALLSFMASDKATCYSQAGMVRPMLFFVMGLATCGLSILSGFITEAIKQVGKSKARIDVVSYRISLGLALLLAAASFVSFSKGAMMAVASFGETTFNSVIVETDKNTEKARAEVAKKLDLLEDRLAKAEKKARELKKKTATQKP